MSGQKRSSQGRSSQKSSGQNDKLSDLLHHPQLWRAGRLERSPDTLPSGFAALDEHLAGGGWPRDALVECLLASAGVGELGLLLPLIRSLSRDETRWVAWINPPFIPYAPALEQRGVDVRKILLIHPTTHQQALWALERANRSGTCSMTLAWLDERQLTLKDTRRLQLAARRGRTLACLFRPREAAAASSMAELRLEVAPDTAASDAVVVDIRKRRGGWPVSGIRLELGRAPGPADIREQLSLWRNRRGTGHGDEAAAGKGTACYPAHPTPDGPAPRVTH